MMWTENLQSVGMIANMHLITLVVNHIQLLLMSLKVFLLSMNERGL